MQQVQEQGNCLQLNQKLFENNGLSRGLGPIFDSFYSFFHYKFKLQTQNAQD